MMPSSPPSSPSSSSLLRVPTQASPVSPPLVMSSSDPYSPLANSDIILPASPNTNMPTFNHHYNYTPNYHEPVSLFNGAPPVVNTFDPTVAYANDSAWRMNHQHFVQDMDDEEQEDDDDEEEEEEEVEEEDDETEIIQNNAASRRQSVIVISTSEEDEDELDYDANRVVLHHKFRGGKHGQKSAQHNTPLSPTSSTSAADQYADQLLYEDVRLQECISKGSLSDLHRGKLWSTTVAVKIIDLQIHSSAVLGIPQVELNHPLAVRRYAQFQTEVKIMRTLRNPNLIEFMGVSVQFEPLPGGNSLPRKLYIITEYLGPSLRMLLSKQTLSFKRCIQLARDIASGLNWLSHKGIVVRNLSPSNLLLASNDRLKVSDYSCALFISEQSVHEDFQGDIVYLIKTKLHVNGYPCYIAPEALTGNIVDSSCDVYSFGLILCEMATGRYPFQLCDSQTSFVDCVLSNYPPQTKTHPHPQRVFAHLEKLILQCCSTNPTARPSFDEILSELLFLNDVAEETLNVDDADIPDEVKRLLEEQHLRLVESQNELEALQQRITEMQESRQRYQQLIEIERRNRINQELKQSLIIEDREHWKKKVQALKKQLRLLEGQPSKNVNNSSNNRKRRNSNASLHP